MTSLDASSTATPPTIERPPVTRAVQGALLVLGAILIAVLIGEERISFFWLPLGVGLTYLAAASAGGRRGGYWATACALVAWGAAVAYLGKVQPTDVDGSGVYLVGAGLGVAGGLVLGRAGFAVGAMGLAVTVVAAGLILALTPRVDRLGDGDTYAVAIGLVGVANVVAGLVLMRRRPPG